MAEAVSRGRSTIAVKMGRAEQEGCQALSSTREDRGKQNTLGKGPTGQTKGENLPGVGQRAEVAPARDKEQGSTALWEKILERENLRMALKREERNGGAEGIERDAGGRIEAVPEREMVGDQRAARAADLPTERGQAERD